MDRTCTQLENSELLMHAALNACTRQTMREKLSLLKQTVRVSICMRHETSGRLPLKFVAA